MGRSLLSNLDTSIFDPDVYIALAAETETIFEQLQEQKKRID
jgi:hypothetical protein